MTDRAPLADSDSTVSHGAHLRPNEFVIYTAPGTDTPVPALVRSTDASDKQPMVDITLPLTGEETTVPADHLSPLPELPDMGERIEGWWRITNRADEEIARVQADTREDEHARARRNTAVRDVERREGGMASRPLWTADGPAPEGVPCIPAPRVSALSDSPSQPCPEPRRPCYPFTVVVGTPIYFNDRDAADRCAAQYGTTVTVN